MIHDRLVSALRGACLRIFWGHEMHFRRRVINQRKERLKRDMRVL
jgi:hypothetical protein